MGFGNPYGDAWSPDMLAEWSYRLTNLFDIQRISLSDTIGIATPALVETVFKTIVPAFPNTEISAHLHALPEYAQLLTEAAFNGGCTYFEGALKGFGGCPMAKDDLTGNMPTEKMLDWFHSNAIETGVNMEALSKSLVTVDQLFH
jgi:hydroxymethylglutaryl-CoA lyase